jgi:flagellar hook-length control protein FliK
LNNTTTNLSSSIKNSVKKISIDLKEKKAKKRTQNEVFENKIEDKNLAEKTFKEISPKIVNHLSRNTEKKINETNLNLKNTNNGKTRFSEKGLDNKQHFMNEQTLDLLESSWGEKFTKILKNSIDNGIQRVEIFLKPKNLGKINLEVLLKDKQTHININTESQETANILNENLPKINDIVEEKNNKFSLLNDNNGNNHSNHQNQGKKNSIDSSVNKKKKINEVKVVRENNRNIDVNA